MKTLDKEIFILIPRLNGSGPSKGAIALSNLLKKSFKITLISLKENEFTYRETLDDGVEKLEFKNYISSFFQFFKFLSKRKPVAVISFCIVPDCFNLISFGNHKKILSFRTNHSSGYKDLYGFFGFILSFIHNLFPLLSHSTIVMSSEHLKKLPKVSRKKTVVIKNFIDKFFDIPKVIFDEDLKHNLIVVSNLTKRKRVHLSIEFANQYSDFFESISIFGKGPEEKKLKEHSEDHKVNCNFFGFVDSPWKKIPKNPCFIHLSEDEGFPRAMLEAMQLNIPTITFNFTGCQEYFNPKDQVIIIKEKDNINNLKAALKILLKKNSDTKNFSFFQENSYERLLESYKRVILD